MRKLSSVIEDLRRYKLSVVAKEIGVHPNVLYRLVGGETDPRYDTVYRIEKFLGNVDES